jgi:hypothetical protein
MSTTYQIMVSDPCHQEMLSYLHTNLMAEFKGTYGEFPFTIEYCFSSSGENTISCDIPVSDPRHFELLLNLQSNIVGSFVEMYGVQPPIINYILSPG